MNHGTLTRLTFSCSKLTIETLEKGNIQMLKNNFQKVIVKKMVLKRSFKKQMSVVSCFDC